ncbi:hypothetical protein [Halovivax gelatinilyticus]|uniref:hypothetical protein n=1 Tax=Halovivax gelatinilyticus TaxID=2961597 RepID=UPI0020CA8302|nr:hypothetical protein [Halovivax gelatinilyticus]
MSDDESADEEIDEEVTQSALVHERLRESPVRRWVLLDGNRYILALSLSIVVFATTAVIGLAGFIPVTEPGTATTLVAAIVGGTLPFITIVLAINQLVLSQELGWPGDLAGRFEGMRSFRRDVESVTETSVSPAAPADFLGLLVESVVDRAASLHQEVDRTADPALTSSVADVVDAVAEEGEIVTDALENADIGTFDALSAVLGHFNGAHRHALRTLSEHHRDELTDEAAEAFDELLELLEYVAVARQSFKTLYMQYELAYLSKLLLYVGFPTLLGGGIFMMTYVEIIAAVGDPTALVFLVSAVVTLVFLPFIVLLVYTFRIATIASRTADFGPFVPRVDFEEE